MYHKGRYDTYMAKLPRNALDELTRLDAGTLRRLEELPGYVDRLTSLHGASLGSDLVREVERVQEQLGDGAMLRAVDSFTESALAEAVEQLANSPLLNAAQLAAESLAMSSLRLDTARIAPHV